MSSAEEINSQRKFEAEHPEAKSAGVTPGAPTGPWPGVPEKDANNEENVIKGVGPEGT